MLTRDAEVRFVIMGHGREERALHALAGQLGVRNRNLFFLPGVPKAEMPAVLSAASISTSLVTDAPLNETSVVPSPSALAEGSVDGFWHELPVRDDGR
jgi:hypothetical protein